MAQTQNQVKISSNLWSRFAEEAQRLKRDPGRLLAELLREYLERMENERLIAESARAARRSGLTEDDDIESLIREIRNKRVAKA